MTTDGPPRPPGYRTPPPLEYVARERDSPAMRPLAATLPVFLCAAACGGPADPADDTAASTGAATTSGTTSTAETTGDVPTTGEPADGPTYWQDVAPIYFKSCVTCHGEGGIGPFRLDTYADARQWAGAAAASTGVRSMPPWLVTDDGTCGTYADSRALTDEEIATIQAWLDAGTPEGEPRDDLGPPAPEVLTDAVDYTTPLFSPEIQGGDLAEYDEYRCFLIDPNLDADRFLTGYSVTPGTPAMIHHVLAITVDPEELGAGNQKNSEIIAALDDASPDRDGWPCFGFAGDGVNASGVPVSWAPGQGVSNLPEGVGFRVKKDDWLVLQVHYNLVDPELAGSTDQTTVHVRYADTVEREGYFDLPDDFLGTLFSGNPAELPPGEPAATYTFDYSLEYLPFFGAETADLYGVFPHMHQRGRKLRVDLVEDGGAPMCAADVQRWDFNWQLYYFYEQPIALTAKSVLRITCEYDTQSASEPVLPGWGTQNEMCLAGLFIVPNVTP